jgi:hypothetical protein
VQFWERMEEIQEIQEVDCSPSSSTNATVTAARARERQWSGDEDGDGWIGRAKELEAPVKIAVAVGKSSSSVQALQWALANLSEVHHGHGDHLLHLLHVQSPIRFVPTPSKSRSFYLVICLFFFSSRHVLALSYGLLDSIPYPPPLSRRC